MSPGFRSLAASALLFLAASAPSAAAPAGAGDPIAEALRASLGALDHTPVPSGILYDRVLPLSGLERFDGTAAAPACDLRRLRQALSELSRASDGRFPLPAPESLSPGASGPGGPVALVVLDAAFDRLRPEALAALREGRTPAGAFVPGRALLAAPRIERTFQGRDVSFVLAAADLHVHGAAALERLEIDPGDGGGFRRAALGEPVRAAYAAPGRVTGRVRLTRAGGAPREAAFTFEVAALAATLPDDTLRVTASEPWLGRYGAGRAYVRYGRGHTSLVDPVVLVEGFDLENSMSWNELFAQVNEQGLADTLWSHGYDAVILDFDEATSPIQENGLLAAELFRQVAAALPPGASMVVAGASMGGLCSRYALAHLERLGESVPVRTWISFDAPHLGANLPLGIQYWVEFFASESAEAAYLLSRIDTPAARQLLVYHHLVPPGTPGPDPQRAAFLADLAAEGDWPDAPRRVAVANGSGGAVGQGFGPGQQIVRWQYSNLLLAVTGNVWALPDHLPQTTIFEGRIRIGFSGSGRTVNVTGTEPYDNAPGGWKATMAEMDAVQAPYGDIVALFPNHCFIPTVSAIALPATGLFTPLLGNPAVPSATPFAAVYLPPANEEHVKITAGNAAFVLGEVERARVSVAASDAANRITLSVAPRPVRGAASISFALPAAARARIGVVDVTGRTVRVLLDGALAAGPHVARWDGADDAGRPLPAGLYFVTLAAGAERRAARAILVR